MVSLTISRVFACTVVSYFAAIMGADHRPGDLPPQPGWPTGFHAAVDQPNRIHGFWVNTTDVLFYQGTTAKVNFMIDALASVPDAKTNVVIHAGLGVATSPWGSGPADSSANWSVTLFSKNGFGKQDRITFDIWVGNGIELSKLEIPATIEVKNGGEIEAFIKNRPAVSPNH